MTHEILCTSAAHGLKPGSHGFCTVVATNATPMSLAEELKSLSGYRHAFPPDGSDAYLNPVNYAHTVLRVDRQQYHVLSRIADAGLDDAGRPNRLAHHVALESSELVAGGPACVLHSPGFCETSWHGETKTLAAGRQPPVDERPPAFCLEWEKLTGDAGWAGVLAEAALADNMRATCIIFEPGIKVLPLVVEALSLLPPEQRWEVTFSTYVANLRVEVDYQWRFLLKGSPEATAARVNPHIRLIDLTTDLGTADGGELVEAARQGPVLKPSRPEHHRSATVTKDEPTAMNESKPNKKPSVPLPPMDEPVELSDIQPVELSDVAGSSLPAAESAPVDPFAPDSDSEEEFSESKPARTNKTKKSPSLRSVPVVGSSSTKPVAGRFPDEIPTQKDQSEGSRKLLFASVAGVLLLVAAGVAVVTFGGNGPDREEISDQIVAANEVIENNITDSIGKSKTDGDSSAGTDQSLQTDSSPMKKGGDKKTPEISNTKNPETPAVKKNGSKKKPATVVAKAGTSQPGSPSKKSEKKPAKTASAGKNKKADKKKSAGTPSPATPSNDPGTRPSQPEDDLPVLTYLAVAQLGALQFYSSEETPTSPRKQIEQGERLLTLPTFHADVWLAESMRLRLLGGSLVEFMVPYEQGSTRPPVIRVLYGRAELTVAGSGDSQLHIRAGASGGENGTITIAGSGDTREAGNSTPQNTTRITIEVVADEINPALMRLFVYAENRDAVVWDGKATLSEKPPGWFQPESNNNQVELTDASLKLVEIVAKDKQLAKADPRSQEYRGLLIELLRKQAKQTDSEDQSLAALSLGSLDDFDHLAKLLSSIDKSQGKKLRPHWEEFVSALQAAALRNPQNTEKVFRALSTRHVYSRSGNELETLRKMVVGYSQAELEKAAAAKPLDAEKEPLTTLFACLQSQKVILRTFAAWNLRHFSKSYFSYKPYDNPSDKTSQRALGRWRKALNFDR